MSSTVSSLEVKNVVIELLNDIVKNVSEGVYNDDNGEFLSDEFEADLQGTFGLYEEEDEKVIAMAIKDLRTWPKEYEAGDRCFEVCGMKNTTGIVTTGPDGYRTKWVNQARVTLGEVEEAILMPKVVVEIIGQ